MLITKSNVLIIYTVAVSVTRYGQKYDENISRCKQVLLNRTYGQRNKDIILLIMSQNQ